MTNVTAILPLQLACQLLSFQNVSLDTAMQRPRIARDVPHGYTVFPDIGMAYKYYENSVSWNEARKYCIAEGGSLARVDTYQKMRYVQSLQKPVTHVSVGYHRLFDNEEWVHVKSGSPPVGLPWREESYRNETHRKCMRLLSGGVYASDCTVKVQFVCEVEL